MHMHTARGCPQDSTRSCGREEPENGAEATRRGPGQQHGWQPGSCASRARREPRPPRPMAPSCVGSRSPWIPSRAATGPSSSRRPRLPDIEIKPNIIGWASSRSRRSAADEDIFQRGGSLVHIVNVPGPARSRRWRHRPPAHDDAHDQAAEDVDPPRAPQRGRLLEEARRRQVEGRHPAGQRRAGRHGRGRVPGDPLPHQRHHVSDAPRRRHRPPAARLRPGDGPALHARQHDLPDRRREADAATSACGTRRLCWRSCATSRSRSLTTSRRGLRRCSPASRAPPSTGPARSSPSTPRPPVPAREGSSRPRHASPSGRTSPPSASPTTRTRSASESRPSCSAAIRASSSTTSTSPSAAPRSTPSSRRRPGQTACSARTATIKVPNLADLVGHGQQPRAPRRHGAPHDADPPGVPPGKARGARELRAPEPARVDRSRAAQARRQRALDPARLLRRGQTTPRQALGLVRELERAHSGSPSLARHGRPAARPRDRRRHGRRAHARTSSRSSSRSRSSNARSSSTATSRA